MAGPPIIEIREPGQRARRVVVDRAIEVGRDCDGEVLSDEGVSRRHLRLVPSPVALSVVDLGSRNGTLVNGVPDHRPGGSRARRRRPPGRHRDHR